VNVVVAAGGRAGLQLAMRRRPRLVVLDADLPDVDGADMANHLRLRVLPHETPIVVLAHDADPRERARFVWSGASAYIVKPLNVAELDRAVMALMEVAALR
jgi:DNA-binding response OmpR family regulator